MKDLKLNEMSQGVAEAIKEADTFLKIAAEQIAINLRKLCEENDIEKNTEEFSVIMNYGNLHASYMFQFYLTFEKLRQQTEKPKNLGDYLNE